MRAAYDEILLQGLVSISAPVLGAERAQRSLIQDRPMFSAPAS
jgi:hypothetical protein